MELPPQYPGSSPPLQPRPRRENRLQGRRPSPLTITSLRRFTHGQHLQSDKQSMELPPRYPDSSSMSRLRARIRNRLQGRRLSPLIVEKDDHLHGQQLQQFQESNSEMVLRRLADPTVSIVGIYGIGGLGKTTLATQLQNQLLNNCFCSVSWVSVSQNFSIRKLQDEITRTVNLDLWDEDDEEKRVEKLSTALEEKNTVLILDDLLHPIPLKDLGIPTGTSGCKLIFTTRSYQVCLEMDCHVVIKMACLSNDEGWKLFMEKIGPDIKFPRSYEQIAKSIVKECSGLPFAIMTMAANMKGVEDLAEWSNALNRIKENKLLQDDDDSFANIIYRVLQYCYDKLKDPIVQQCLLYCESYPQEFKIDREMLIENLIDAGLVDGKNREAEFNNGNATLDKLENAFLLEGGTCKYGKRYVKMNNLVREFLRSLSGSLLPSVFHKRIPEDDDQFMRTLLEHKTQLDEMPIAGEAVTGSADPGELLNPILEV